MTAASRTHPPSHGVSPNAKGCMRGIPKIASDEEGNAVAGMENDAAWVPSKGRSTALGQGQTFETFCTKDRGLEDPSAFREEVNRDPNLNFKIDHMVMGFGKESWWEDKIGCNSRSKNVPATEASTTPLKVRLRPQRCHCKAGTSRQPPVSAQSNCFHHAPVPFLGVSSITKSLNLVSQPCRARNPTVTGAFSFIPSCAVSVRPHRLLLTLLVSKRSLSSWSLVHLVEESAHHRPSQTCCSAVSLATTVQEVHTAL